MANEQEPRAGRTIGVVLMTFGSPATLDDVPAYMTHVRGGREASAELVAEFRHRYELVGGSPLIEITRDQASAVQAELTRRSPTGPRFVATVGMRHSPPFIGEAIEELANQGIDEIRCVIMSPQYSPFIMGGYHRAVDDAVAGLAARGTTVQARVAGAWHTNPNFLAALTERVNEALARLPADARATVPVLLTCHSLPKRVVDKEPAYLEQIHETVQAIVDRVGLTPDRWQFAYQSAGHTPEEWLKPDMKDLLPGLREKGHRHVLMVPVQFLADHLEILYDIDVAAREDAEALGMGFHRIESLNLSPKFIAALADAAEAT
ncbi:MAG TPA: ferrochelatase [Chloroflexota bacterium]|nr:ferrochelatase [Chloroflexota bacterium]